MLERDGKPSRHRLALRADVVDQDVFSQPLRRRKERPAAIDPRHLLDEGGEHIALLEHEGVDRDVLARAPLNLYLVEGGYPIIVEEMMVGALGVGGASGGDEECGHAALTKVLGPQPPIVPPVRPNAVGPAAPPAQGR